MRRIFLSPRAHWLLVIEAHWSFCQRFTSSFYCQKRFSIRYMYKTHFGDFSHECYYKKALSRQNSSKCEHGLYKRSVLEDFSSK